MKNIISLIKYLHKCEGKTEAQHYWGLSLMRMMKSKRDELAKGEPYNVIAILQDISNIH